MMTELEAAGYRFSVFADQVLEPAVYTSVTPLDVAVFQCPQRIPYAEAIRQTYKRIELGWRWGPAWSTAWFHVTGRVLPELADWPAALRFSCGSEALLWQAGTPYQGLDDNHPACVLFDPARGGEEIDLYIEGACNRRLGVTTFWWDEQEMQRRWQEPKPGRLAQCDLAAFDPAAWRLWRTFDFARQLMLLCAADSERARRLCDGLRRAIDQIDDRDVAGSASRAQQTLEDAIRGQSGASQTECCAVGHAHIDTAWLWPIRETRRKCQRTFSTTLRLMEQYPEFAFIHTQAQQYAWLEESSPELFAQVAERVRAGRWEAGGAMWVEPDCNLPAGESLVRQILHGTRYWEARFGQHGRQPYLYLPDSFGFPASLPQIMRLAGLETFITTKLSWNETNEFPHASFRWRGIDGSEVLAHCTPGQDYNAAMTPAELLRGEKNAARLDHARAGIWLQPFGHGDGGGGTTDWSIHFAQLAAQCEGLPHAKLARVDEFCRELHQRRAAQQAEGRDWPVWDGELYLELHRGTYTTCAWIKQANRRAELGLHLAEWLTFGGPTRPAADQEADAQQRLDQAWKLLLLNQFHDILPGVSVADVYDDAREQLAQVREAHDALIAAGLRRWAEQVDTTGLEAPLVVFNPTSSERSGFVECDGQEHYVEKLPPCGLAVIDRATPASFQPAHQHGRTLSNGIISATIDTAGRVVDLRRANSERSANAPLGDGSRAPLNQLVLYEDRPRAWEAWDLDAEYAEKPFAVEGPDEHWQVVEPGPQRAAIEVTRPLGEHSRITQRFVLEAGSPRLDVHSRVDWHESRRVLRVLFPVDVRARQATYEIAFGHIRRPTHRNTSWDRAMFEVPAHRWMDLSEPGFGVALLNDCKYGHSCDGHVLGLTLLRSPKFPNPQVDMGSHEFTYSLMVHDGDWRTAGVDRQAETLNAPLLALPAPPGQAGPIHGTWAPFNIAVSGAARAVLSASKRAEADDRLIVRLVETHGGAGQVVIGWNLPVQAVESVDLLERPLPIAGVSHDESARRTTIELRPFQIVTLAASRS